LKSSTLKLYARWLSSATPEQVAFVDEILAACERNYEAGADVIVECYGPAEILAQFTSLDDVRAFVRVHNSRAADARWGDDDDHEINKPEWSDA
jgi:hypothetical protein